MFLSTVHLYHDLYIYFTWIILCSFFFFVYLCITADYSDLNCNCISYCSQRLYINEQRRCARGCALIFFLQIVCDNLVITTLSGSTFACMYVNYVIKDA